MSDTRTVPIGSLGYGFITGRHVPEGADEYYLRDAQSSKPAGVWRHLRSEEIETLVKNGNTAQDWDEVRVSDHFAPHLVTGCEFYGLVRIGRLDEVYLEHHDLTVPAGLTHSRIISCDIGDNAAIHHVRYVAHYIIGDHVILLNLDEMHATNHAKFGNGIVKKGEREEVRIWMDVVNETGGRRVMPFDGMTPADACLWATSPEDRSLQKRLGEITQRQFDPRRGFYGTVGDECVIKNCRIIKDVKFGPSAYVKGANKLKNVTINSSRQEPSQIGEGVELVNGIVGRGCHVFYGCKAVRFVMGDGANLKYGARLVHSYLGDNSTISCCEALNDLIFPAHEQHHNNSFLIAALVKGQSNIAACATIGSNHTSRKPDGEFHAGRGFWPGLCVSVKANCRFASFTLLAKGDYAAELDVPLPFSLVSDDVAGNRLQIMPGYWWLYNMYALARNSSKFAAGDTRKRKVQNIEFETLAPDTVEEMFAAMALLERWTAKAHLGATGRYAGDWTDDALRTLGRELLRAPGEQVDQLTVLGESIENSSRDVVILKPRAGYGAYREMIHHYAVKELIKYMEEDTTATLASMRRELAGRRERHWVNLGGQLIRARDFDALKDDIKSGKLDAWPDIHVAYDAHWRAYPRQRQRHAFASLVDLLGVGPLTRDAWREALDEAARIQEKIARETLLSRTKDFDNPFRKMVYESDAQMKAVLGTPERDTFIRQIRGETSAFDRRVNAMRKRG